MEKGRILELPDFFKKGRASLWVRTIDPNQPQAAIPIYLIEDGHRRLLKKISLTNLKPEEQGYSRLYCSFTLNGNKIELRIDHHRRRVYSETITIGRSKTWIWWALGGLALLAILFFLIRLTLPGSSSPMVNSQNTTTVEDRQSDSSSQDSSQESSETMDSNTAHSIGTSDELTDQGDISIQENADADSGALSEESNENQQSDSTMDSYTEEVEMESIEEEQDATVSEPVEEPEVVVVSTPQGHWITVYFEAEQDYITEEALEQLLQQIEAAPIQGEIALLISGHCAIYGNERGQQILSQNRADRVAQWIMDHSSIQATQIEAQGMGIRQTVTQARDQQHLNRRVEVQVFSN